MSGAIGMVATSDTGIAFSTSGGRRYAGMKGITGPTTYNATINDHLIIVIGNTGNTGSTGSYIYLPNPSTNPGSEYIIRNVQYSNFDTIALYPGPDGSTGSIIPIPISETTTNPVNPYILGTIYTVPPSIPGTQSATFVSDGISTYYQIA
jgi:hypothetical protein